LDGLTSFFAGDWGLVRRIRDLKTHEVGRLRGVARFAPDGGDLRFTERGLLVLRHTRTEARRDSRFVIESPDSFSVFFADGRFFHRAEIAASRALVVHDCAPDRYCGRYRFYPPDRWVLSWRITGPRKDLVISSIFSRGG
jgi:hypothetical protein